MTKLFFISATISGTSLRFNAPTASVATPLDPKLPLVEASELELLGDEDAAEYCAAVGALLYLMLCTGPR